jgi:hypothetical protein
VLKNWALTAERWASSLIHQKEAYKRVLAPYIGDGSPTTQTMWLDELTEWPGLTKCVTTPGSHFGLLTEYVTQTAQTIRYLVDNVEATIG